MARNKIGPLNRTASCPSWKLIDRWDIDLQCVKEQTMIIIDSNTGLVFIRMIFDQSLIFFASRAMDSCEKF